MPSIQERLQESLADRYLIERELGRGGMATVFLARDLKHDRAVAIKVLHPDLSATIGADRFEREIRLAAKLQHPQILGLYDSGEADGLLFYVMPFIEGESLRDRLDRDGQLPIEDALSIVLEVADALGYAHKHGVVHRDIKPENILLSGDHAVVADFGIASALSDGGGQKLTQTGMAVGTPVYMAPEQTAGEQVGPTSDLYSLGCMLYEILAGEPPFTAKTAHALMARHAMESVPSIRIIRNTVPEEVEDAIFAAMAKVPADRPQTAAQFAEMLGLPLGATASRRATIRATATRRIPTQSMTALDLPRPWWRRPAVAGVAVVMLLGAGAYAAWTVAQAGAGRRVGALDPASRRVAVLYFDDRSGDGQLRSVADGLTEALIRKLGEVSALSVVSRNGVAPYRGSDVAPDSISRALEAGTLIRGSVEALGADKVRITTELLDHGLETRRRNQLDLTRDQLVSAEDSVAALVTNRLREWIGDDIRLRETQARSTSLAAWSLANRAGKLRKDAALLTAQDRTAAAGLLRESDSLLTLAAAEDKGWVDPVVERGEVAFDLARLTTGPEREQWLVAAEEAAAEALRRDSQAAAALGLRGSLAFARWRQAVTVEPAVRKAMLANARADLERAVDLDPSLASAFAQLSFVYYSDKSVSVALALEAARKAYQADAFLSSADLILDRLFWSSYDTNGFSDAEKWCAEGRKRFPADRRFAECSLWLMLQPNTPVDISAAWQTKALTDSLTTPADLPFAGRLTTLIVGGVIAKQAKGVVAGTVPGRALADSADRVLLSARGDRTVDPRQELLGYEAIMRAQGGDPDQAIALLREYVAVNPEHSFEVAGNTHWWWASLQALPEFRALLARR